mmetsp:Transcript_9925/g.36893  ORF Transcript_9925/g.36893 Transcript_9925/m.36893 type:complete len:276 (+) Transcript_9925:1044-1871(+)
MKSPAQSSASSGKLAPIDGAFCVNRARYTPSAAPASSTLGTSVPSVSTNDVANKTNLARFKVSNRNTTAAFQQQNVCPPITIPYAPMVAKYAYGFVPPASAAASPSNTPDTARKIPIPTGSATSASHLPCTSSFARTSPRFSFRPKCCMKVPFIKEPRPVSAALRTNVADAASGRNSAGAAGVSNSIARATSSSALLIAHHRFGSSSYFCPPKDPAASVLRLPSPSFNTHFVAAVNGSAPGVLPIPSATRSDCAVNTSKTLRNIKLPRCHRMKGA